VSGRTITDPSHTKRIEGLKTVGEVRQESDDTLLSFQGFGSKSLADLRDGLGLPSANRVRPRRS
jgi:hypothetical protein